MNERKQESRLQQANCRSIGLLMQLVGLQGTKPPQLRITQLLHLDTMGIGLPPTAGQYHTRFLLIFFLCIKIREKVKKTFLLLFTMNK